MVIDTRERDVKLSFPTDEKGERRASCRVRLSDGLLPRDSRLFSGTAALAAAVLSLSCGDKKLLSENLNALSYGDIRHYYNEGGEDRKIGLSIGSRVRDDKLEVAVVLQGTEGAEWYSNFDLGYSAEHRGFSFAADFAELKLMDYVFTRAIGLEPSFFISGYSRGGAVANILAKRLSDRYGINRVWCYTFASPATTLSRRVGRYSSIFNLVRAEDFFTRVPPEGWGYIRYGHDISLSDLGDINEPFRRLTGEDYLGFTRRGTVDNFLRSVMTLAPNVHAYYERRRCVGERRLSLYEFMTGVADMLADQMDETAADTFLSAMVSDYADLLTFLSSGADLMEMLSSAGGVPRCSVADSHSPAAYMASLQLFLG